MRKLLYSLPIALLLATALASQADKPLAATQPSTAQAISPPAVTAPNPVLPIQAAPTQPAPLPGAGTPKRPAPEQGATMPAAGAAAGAKAAAGVETGAALGIAGAREAAVSAKPPVDLTATELTKLKHQIKTVRLSLADTQGRLAVTEQDLLSATGANTQLRSENTNLRVGLAKAETVAKKSEEELGHRRQEVKAPPAARPSSGSGALAIGLLLSLIIITGILAVVLLGQGDKLRTILNRMPDGEVDEDRHDQLRTQLKEEQQRSQRFEEEIKRLRAVAESQSNAPAGSKRDKLDNMKRELREARAVAEAEKRQADERIQKLEAEVARVTADKQQVDERVQKLEPEMAQLVEEKQQVFEQVQKLEPEVARLAAEKVEADERVRKLEPEVARLAAEKVEADERFQKLKPEVARLVAEKLRLERAVVKANQRLTFFGHDEPEETPPPYVG